MHQTAWKQLLTVIATVRQCWVYYAHCRRSVYWQYSWDADLLSTAGNHDYSPRHYYMKKRRVSIQLMAVRSK